LSKPASITDYDSRLAMELAIEISDLPEILKRYDLSKAELKAKLENPAFRRAVQDAKITWNSDLSVKERIRVKSMVLIEDSILEIYNIIHDKDITPTARIDAFKTLSRTATTDAPDKEGAAAGDRVHITFNIPGVEKPVTYDAEVVTDGREAITHGA
jgi:hypothetical protein